MDSNDYVDTRLQEHIAKYVPKTEQEAEHMSLFDMLLAVFGDFTNRLFRR